MKCKLNQNKKRTWDEIEKEYNLSAGSKTFFEWVKIKYPEALFQIVK